MEGKMLVCAATEFELMAFVGEGEKVVSGVGIPATFAGLRRPEALPGLLLNIGVGGAYPGSGIGIGDVVVADGEVYGDVGFELPEEPGFRAVTDSPFGEFYREPLPTVRPPEWARLDDAELGFKVHVARGCTVNSCTGTQATGIWRRDRFGVGFESMEGAAVAQIGREWGVPVCEIRAISNIAGDRDMRPENIRRALDSLRIYLKLCVESGN